MYSFDVYDTLITRTVIEPTGIFRLMSAVGDTPDNFCDVRIAAERKARQNKGGEIHIDDIYNELASFCGLREEQRDKLVELEIQLEEINSIPVISNIKRVEELVKSGEKVVLISDMYLSSGVYKRIFSKVAPALELLPLYISCECDAVKSDGSLYEYVSRCEQAAYSDWIHIGDNKVSDVIVPEMLGIKAEKFSLPPQKTWEARLQAAVHDQVAVQLVSGLSRNARVNNSGLAFSVGYSFAGPILYSYVLWIVKKACDIGIKRLYFLSRDGYVLKEVADVIIEESNAPLTTFYIYSSRKAWNAEGTEDQLLLKRYIQQEIPEMEKKDFAFVDAKGTGRTLDRVAMLVGQEFEVFFYHLLEPVGEKRLIAYPFASSGGLIEAICRAPHGITLSYEEKNGRIYPVLGGDSNGEMDEYLLAAKSFARDCYRTCQKNIIDCSMFAVSEWLMQYAEKRPDRELASYIGDIVHNEKNNGQRYAPEVTAEKIREIEYIRTTEPVSCCYDGHNLEYSYLRLDEENKAYVNKCRKDFSLRDNVEKKPDAQCVLIYGFGVCGREAYHRLLWHTDFIVQAIVDQNYERFSGVIPEVCHPIKVRELQYDYLLIAMIDKKQVERVEGLLIRAGVNKDKLISWEEFEDKFLNK